MMFLLVAFGMGAEQGGARRRPATGDGPCHLKLAAVKAKVGAFMPRCEADGSFSSKQCHGSTGHCWCVYSSGKKIPGTKVGPGKSVDCSKGKSLANKLRACCKDGSDKCKLCKLKALKMHVTKNKQKLLRKIKKLQKKVDLQLKSKDRRRILWWIFPALQAAAAAEVVSKVGRRRMAMASMTNNMLFDKLVEWKAKLQELKKSKCGIMCWIKKAELVAKIKSIMAKIPDLKKKFLTMILDMINRKTTCGGLCAKSKAFIEKLLNTKKKPRNVRSLFKRMTGKKLTASLSSLKEEKTEKRQKPFQADD